MPIVVKTADLERDRDRLIDLLREHLNPLTDRRRFDWMYCLSPFGPARIWMAVDEDSGEIVGSAAALPRPMYLRGRAVDGCVYADFWVHPSYRVLGPALKLQRACLAAVDTGAFAVAYDFPRRAMVAVYKRLGFSQDAALVRLVRPLRLDRHVGQRIRVPWAARFAGGLANALLRTRDWSFSRRPEYEVSSGSADFGPEFSALAEALAHRHSPCVVRSAQYLNWRFRDHFHLRFDLLTARRGTELAGYMILSETADSLDVADGLFRPDPAVLRDLVNAAVALARSRGKYVLNALLCESSDVVPALQRLGFHARERQAVVAYAPGGDAPDSPPRPLAADATWWFTAGDESD